MDKDEEYMQLIIDYKEVFDTQAGKNVLNDLMRESGYYVYYRQPPQDDKKHSDVEKLVYREGQKSMIARIIMMVNKDPNEKKGMKHE